jgi:hypothetical protein
MKTPKEMANSTNNDAEHKEWLAQVSPREIQQYIANIRVDPMGHMYQHARVALEVKLGEDALEAAKKVERQTDKLILLTWFLAILTAALFAVEVRAVFFPKDSPAPKQDKQAGEKQQIVVPPVTNR